AAAGGGGSHGAAHGQGVPSAASVSEPSSRPARSAATPRADRAGSAIEVTGERQQRQHARALDRGRELLLVHRARARHAPRHDLAAIGHEPPQALLVLVVDERDLLQAQLAVLLLDAFAFTLFRHCSNAPFLRLDPRTPQADRHAPRPEPSRGSGPIPRAPPASGASRRASSSTPASATVLPRPPRCPCAGTAHRPRR